MTRHPVTPCSQITWGIIRYPAGSGLHPDDDAAGFDGWYYAVSPYTFAQFLAAPSKGQFYNIIQI